VTAHGRPLRAVGEGLVILLSILLAFGIDAWWDERGVRLEVQRELQNVAGELGANRERITQSLAFLDRISEGTTDLLGRLDARPDESVIMVPDTVAWLGQSVPVSPDLSFGALDALVSSGRLAFVADPVARAGLSQLRGRIGDAEEGQLRLVQLYDAYYMPLLAPSIDLSAVYAVGDFFWSSDRSSARALPSRSAVAFPNSQEVRNYLRLRGLFFNSDVVEWGSVLEIIDAILDRLGSA
jgi:hypothetical protein